ncbi:MAG: serine/threonine-protein kinase [Cyanobacteria bacterium P01_A01_bin.17]
MLGRKLADRYKIVKSLGGGGFSKTFLAIDTQQDKRRCIVKKLQTDSDDDFTVRTARRLFSTEVKVLKRLGKYDQVPELFDNFVEDQDFFLVEQYIDGRSLKQELQWGRRWSEAKVIAFLQDILTTLAFVHQQSVIHRDLKPANIIRRRKDKKVVLIDFGSVKSQRQPSRTVVIGTSGYMPGEQSMGRPNYSSDIYAAGMIAIQALTGRDPAKGKLSANPKTGEILWRRYANVTPALAEVLDKMVRYDFRQRYSSAMDALEAIEPITQGGFFSRRRVFQAVGFWGMALLGSGIAYGAFNSNPSFSQTLKRVLSGVKTEISSRQ